MLKFIITPDIMFKFRSILCCLCFMFGLEVMVVVLGQLAYPEKMEIDKAKANLNVSPPIYNSDILVMCVCVRACLIYSSPSCEMLKII